MPDSSSTSSSEGDKKKKRMKKKGKGEKVWEEVKENGNKDTSKRLECYSTHWDFSLPLLVTLCVYHKNCIGDSDE